MVKLLFIDGLELDFFNPRSILVFICLLQGVVFAALLVARYRRQCRRADLWLALLLLLLCASLITPFIGFANVYDRNQWLTFFPFHLAYSYGVCVWFYVLTLTDAERRFRGRDWWFFLPSALYLAMRLVLFAQPLAFKVRINPFYEQYIGPFVFLTEFAWNTALLALAVRHYRKYRAWLDENFSDTEKLKFDWLRNFLYVFTFVLVVGALFDFTNSFLVRLSYIQYFYFELVLAFATYYLAVAGYLRSAPIELHFTEEAAAETETRRSVLAADELEKLKARIEKLMETERLYLEPALALNDLARALGVSAGVLSFAINQGFGVNFNDFVNEYRIREVKEQLRRGEAEKRTLTAIAFDCGFNSKATFNRAFRKFTGRSPKEYAAGE